MTFNSKLIEIINNDLKIKKFSKESDTKYYARIIYTALSMWIRTSVIPLANEEKSKGIIINKIKKRFDEIVAEIPDILIWYNLDGLDTHPVTEITKRLIRTGEIIEYGFYNELILPEFEKCYLYSFFYMYRGFYHGRNSIFSGLIPIVKEKNKEINIMNDLSYFGMDKSDSVDFLDMYIKNSKWRKVDNFKHEIFDYSCKYNNSNCWVNEQAFSDFEVTLYKNEFFDFGFVKKFDGDYFISEISDYLRLQYEVRRFMYGLKKKNGERSKAFFKVDDINQSVCLKLTSSLPMKEESIFSIIGWPKNNISDNCNFIFHLAVWEIVTQILERLNIELKEIVNE